MAMFKEREDGSLNASMPVSFMLIELHGDNGIYGHAIIVK